MASFAQPIAFFFFLVLSSPLHIQARESKFFTNFIHLRAKISPLAAPTPSPEVAPVLAPTPANFDSQDPYYGLYGHGSNMFPTAKEGVTTSNTPTAASNFENDLFTDERYEKNNNNNYEFTTSNYNYNNNDNGYTLSNYKYNTNGYNGNYNDNGYETERQGMSDTRFVEGGKHFYNVEKDNHYPNGYEFSSSKGTSENEGYYGNTDNSMEEFENKGGEYQEREEEYAP
ncbi:GBF's pro-rich region-interacting factor 1 [Hibiscus syriacus]|uniref:GBF's pro-rich region-interacting factor 1 n=1 Tax=Hibiscus syriacus TaxID=106335 RepID=A0A6A2XCH6_HIBSY|nr:GBF's pro-rich region-interacting factor 1 [Hibiscus syriacus]